MSKRIFVKKQPFLLCVIIIFYLFNSIQYIQSQSITSDEGTFYDYAKRFMQGDPSRVTPRSDNSKMPVVVLNTLPRVAQSILNPGLKKSDGGVSDIMMGRYITLLISVLTILLVYKWAKEIYGLNAALFSALLMSLCPNNLANAGLVTTDSYSVFMLLLCMYALWNFLKYSGMKRFIFFSVIVALSQLVKQSLFHLYILVPLIFIIYFFVKKPAGIKIAQVLKYILIFAIINWFVINAGYYFYQTNCTLDDYHFMSNLFQSLQKNLPGGTLIPLPKPFVDGLDMAKYYDQLGGGYDQVSSFGKVTILGNSSTGGAFWYYYFVTLFYKTPIADLVFFCWSINSLWKTQSKNLIQNQFFLFLPVVYFLTLLSFFYKTQCGIRHIIIAYPFLFIAAGSIIPTIKSVWAKILVSGLTVFLLVSVLTYWSNYFPYTNEFITDKKMAYTYVGASNLEFLQGKYFLADYLSKHPEVHTVPDKPSPGVFIINTEDYLDVWNRHKYDWIAKIKPSGQVAYNWLLITLTNKDLAQ